MFEKIHRHNFFEIAKTFFAKEEYRRLSRYLLRQPARIPSFYRIASGAKKYAAKYYDFRPYPARNDFKSCCLREEQCHSHRN